MTKDDITVWALANCWQMIDGIPSLARKLLNPAKADGSGRSLPPMKTCQN
jgi:hypothetical protein